MESFSFMQLIRGEALKGIDRIVIPKIQRDYAQGRKGTRASDVRHLFSASLLATLKATDGEIQMLDFIYGYLRDGCFEPLDGQQRLTTMFLLHWLTLPKPDRGELVKNDTRQPCLSYLTRPSARDFCKFLVNIDMDALAENFDSKVAALENAVEKKGSRPKLSASIKELDDYRYNWEVDPTVKSMLRMLDAFMAQLRTFSAIKKIDAENLNNIRFHIRNLDDLKQGDDLYVKMNARGLELSDFDNTKSALEGDMLAAGVAHATQANWREGMDGPWIDFFWHRAKADDPNATLKIEKIHSIEDDLKTFVLRLGALHWLDKIYGNCQTPYEEAISNLTELSNTKRDALNSSLTKYLQLRFNATHSKEDNSAENAGTIALSAKCPVIDYEAIVDDMASLLYLDSDNHRLSADSLILDGKVRTNDEKSGEAALTFIDDMLANDFTHGNRLRLYGMLAFTRELPAKMIAQNAKLAADWTTWMRLLRNLTMLRNTSTHQFDSSDKVVRGMAGIKSFVDGFIAGLKNNGALTMSEHIRSTAAIEGFDPEIFIEEQMKETLRADKAWADCLDENENSGYLFGQLRAPLQWAGGDLDKFKNYSNMLNTLLREDLAKPLYVALLLTSEMDKDKYPFNNSLLLFDYNRDRSFKRYLREKVDGVYAPALKRLIDMWFEMSNPYSTIEGFLARVIAERKNSKSLPLWKRQIAEYPEMITERSYNRGIEISDRAYFIEKKRADKKWNINLCWLKKTRYASDDFVIHNTKEDSEFNDSISMGKTIFATGTAGNSADTAILQPRHRKIGCKREKKN